MREVCLSPTSGQLVSALYIQATTCVTLDARKICSLIDLSRPATGLTPISISRSISVSISVCTEMRRSPDTDETPTA